MKGECPAWWYWLVLIVGVLYLLVDFGAFSMWGTINWWTAAFILMGLAGLAGK